MATKRNKNTPVQKSLATPPGKQADPAVADFLEASLCEFIEERPHSDGQWGYLQALLDMARYVKVPSLATIRMAHAMWDAHLEERANA